MDFAAILKGLAPVIGTAVAGPLGGAAVGWLADKLGVPKDDTTAITQALQGIDPMKMKELEQQFQEWYISEQDGMIKSYLADTQSARQRDTDIKKAGQHNYRADWIVFVTFAGILLCVGLAVASSNINEFGKSAIMTVLGVLIADWKQITSFEFGSSKSSQGKDKSIQDLIGKV